MLASPAAAGAKSVVAAPAAVPTVVIVTVWEPIVSGAPAAKLVTLATFRFVSPAAAASTVVVLPGAVPTLSSVTVSAPSPRITDWPCANPATLETRRTRSPALAALNRVALPWMQHASSAAAWALVSGISVRAGPEIQVPFHSDGLR